MATDTGHFQINDLVFEIPPDAIQVNRKSVNNYWQTLRTRSSIKLSSGYSLLDIQVSTKIIATSNELQKLTDLISQIRVTPFCWVDNQYLRNSILGGKSKQAMVLAMKQIELRKASDDNTNVIEVYMYFSWFNYLPFMKDWLYKEDIFVPKPVRNPIESRAWRTMYRAEQRRGDYQAPKALTNSNVVLDLRQFMVVGKKNYLQIKQDLAALRDLRLELLNFTPPADSSEFNGMPQEILDSLVAKAGKDEAQRLVGDIFGNSTSMGDTVVLSEIVELVDRDITAKQELVESWGKIAQVVEDTWQASLDKNGKQREVVDKIDARIDDKDLKGINNQLLMESKQQLDFNQAGLIVTGISISFENVLATMPVIGHPFPSYQHIGSTDGIVSISFITTEEAAVQALASFYTICEDQSRKFRQVPEGVRNINVTNDLTRMCGLREFIVEDLKQSTVPGSPGTYSGELVLANNPITSTTAEQLAPGQSFTTSAALRLEIAKVLDQYVRFKEEKLTIKDRNLLERGVDFVKGDLHAKAKQEVVFKRSPVISEDTLVQAPILRNPTSFYTFGKIFNERENMLQSFVARYMRILSKAFEGLLDTFVLDHQTNGFRSTSISLLTIAEDEIVGVGRLRRDLISVTNKLRQQPFDRFAGGLQHPPKDNTSGENTFGDMERLRGFIREKWQEMKDEPTEIQRKKIQEIFKRAEELTVPGTEPGLYIDKYFEDTREEFISEYLADFNSDMVDLLDELQRSDAFDLDIFEEVRNLSQSSGLPTSGNNYPDFPLVQVVEELKSREDWDQIKQQFEKNSHFEGLGVYNLGFDVLINPDFYLYNQITDSTSDIIGRDLLNQARNAIKISQSSDQRGKAEKEWVTGVYEKHIIGKARAERIREDIKAGTTNVDRRGKITTFRQKLAKGSPNNQQIIREIGEREKKLANDVWRYDDFEGSLGCTLIENEPSGDATEGVVLKNTISQDEDKTNTTILERKGSLIPDRENHSKCKHRFDIENSLDELPESFYAPPPPPDPNKDPVWFWPTTEESNARISSHFGIIRNGLGRAPHKGIDVVRRGGNSTSLFIRAAATGQIVAITEEFKRGTEPYEAPALKGKIKEDTVQITLKHANGWKTVYKHLQWDNIIRSLSDRFHGRSLDPNAVSQAIYIEGGETIGILGSTGFSTGPHLHFEILKNNKPVDPLIVLNSNFHKSQGPISGIDPNNESLFSKSIEQFEKELQSGQGYSLMRAYPAFRLYFIETDLEERKTFAFDDFFSYSAIQDIQFVRSRKIPSDLLVLTLTNVSGVLTNRKFRGQGRENIARDSKGKIVKENPVDVGARNTLRENAIASLMLQPGIQVQLRLGYNASPEELEKPFNGIITDVQLSEDDNIVRITCQSFAIELTQKVYGEAKKFGGWFDSSGKTGEILEELMAQPEVVHFGRWNHGEPNNFARGLLTNRFQFIPKPADDNIFAPTGSTGIFGWLDSSSKYIMYNTTIWDTFQEMTLRHPAYISYPVPYEGLMGPRMTMFFGVPNQLYFARDPTLKEKEAYQKIKQFVDKSVTTLEEIQDATKDGKNLSSEAKAAGDGSFGGLRRFSSRGTYGRSGGVDKNTIDPKLREVWINRALLRFAKDRGFIKPFRNYHVLTSTMHILKNTISSSSWNTFNTVTLQYEEDTPDINKDTQTLSFDNAESYTQKCDAGVPDEEVRELMTSWNNCVGEEMAKRYATSLLWNSLKEGYSGTIVVIGNPSIKPHDICYVYDEYNDIFGPIEVEQVVHRFSQNTGFITEITPDMCIHVNQASTMAVQDAMGLVAESALSKIGMDSLASIINSSRGIERTAGLPRADGVNLEASTFADKLAGAATRTAHSIAFSPLAMTNPLGILGGVTSLTGKFILRKMISRSQDGHRFTYSPLVQQGRPMIGGMPTKYVDGSFIQGIKTWFKDTNESQKLYLSDMYDKIVVNDWVRPRGDASTILKGE